MKIICIIQARMGSERLPGKVMKAINGEPMICYTLDRTKRSRYIDEVILATSEKETENQMVDYLQQRGDTVFRGDENNVLKRYADAVNQYGGDIVIRLTGDCPFIDAVIIDQVITYFLMNTYDYVRLDVPNSFIRGFDVEVFTKSAMDRVCEITRDMEEVSPYKEHVTFYMYKHPEEFKIGIVKGSKQYRKNYRLCVDTAQDFELVRTLYENFQDKYINAIDIVQYLDQNPKLAEMNKEIEQKHIL